MLIYIAVAAIILYAIYKERQALGCPSNIFDGTDCDNANGKAVKGCFPLEGITLSKNEILDKIEFGANYHKRWVQWRINFMFAVFVTVIIGYVWTGNLISERDLVTGIVVIMLCVLLVTNFYKFHLSDHVFKGISECVNKLR